MYGPDGKHSWLRPSLLPYALHAGLFTISLALLYLSGPVLPLADYPNHLARAYVIHNIGRIPALAEAYQVQWQFTPYFVMETTLDLLQHVVTIYTAGKIFIGICLVSIVLGVIGINLALWPSLSVTTLLVYPIFFSQVFLFGYLNFTLGAGVALLSYAWWLRDHARKYSLVLLFVLFNINFFTHPLSYAILVAMIALRSVLAPSPGTSALERGLAGSKIVALALPQLPFWLFIPHDTLHNRVPFYFGDLHDRIWALLSPFLFAVNTASIVTAEILLIAILVACLKMRLVTADRVHLGMVLVLWGLCLLVPAQMLGVSFLFLRLPFMTALLMVAVLGERNLRPMAHRALLAGVLVLNLLHFAIAYPLLSGCSARMEELRLAFARYVTTPGTPLLSVQDASSGRCESLPFAFSNIGTLAVIESHSFSPQLFTIMPPVRAAARYQDIELRVGRAAEADHFFDEAWRSAQPYFAQWQTRFNYVVWLHFGHRDRIIPGELRPVAEGSYFTVFEVPSFRLPQ